ncbi:PqiB family protein [Yoonia litorea]|uniref:Paraquat-inducible protein B n=1 Tax=Yoonia litorea TaxID=1123755 RepID=A0A1I6LRN5_9RHOB|nr:MlaD family protein [Yoonia litorea]SFS06093.1 paraquat-inducible protein B [Yoonia litorea]
MTDTPPSGPAPLDIREGRSRPTTRLSIVWLVPLIALAVSLWAAWQSYVDRGTLITISFENASGVVAGETKIKYRDVDVGEVERVEFSDGLSDVLVHARIDKTVAPFLDDDAEFWVVRPDVSVRGITGLETVLSGVFIEGNWDTEADVQQYEFTGLETPNLTRASQRGTSVVLRADDGGSIAAGAPVLHKGIEVGYLEEPELSFDGRQVVVSAFIESPYDRRLTTATRFWDTSGFSVSFGANGVSLNVNSLASLIEGGIAFDTLVSGGSPINEGHRFDIYDDRQAARESLFSDPNEEVLRIAVLFEETVSGLTSGAEVRLQGIRVGEVSDLNAIVVGEGERAQVRLQAVLDIEPSRLGMEGTANADTALILLSDLVARGLRARMVTGNILAGTLDIELVQVPDALPAIINLTSGEFPVIPTTESQISDVAATAEGLLARVNALPVEELLDSAISLMGSVERLVNDDATRATPEALVALLDETRSLVTSQDVQSIPSEMRVMLAEIEQLIGDANESGLIADLDVALASVTQAADNIELATRNLPQITADIEALTQRATELEFEVLITSASDTLRAIDTLISTDAAIALPASLNGALDEMRTFLAEVREGGAIENVTAALEAANQAARAIEASVQDLPALAARANRLVAQTEEVIESYSQRSRFGAETLQTLRDIQDAADSVTTLSRQIQRNPNSLLTGR